MIPSLRIDKEGGYAHCGTNATKWAAFAGDPNYNLLNECCLAINGGNPVSSLPGPPPICTGQRAVSAWPFSCAPHQRHASIHTHPPSPRTRTHARMHAHTARGSPAGERRNTFGYGDFFVFFSSPSWVVRAARQTKPISPPLTLCMTGRQAATGYTTIAQKNIDYQIKDGK